MSVEALEVDCPYCAEKINGKAKKCKHCGEILDATMRELELLKSQKKDVFINNSASSSSSASAIPSGVLIQYRRRSKETAILWCLFLGGVGAHKFYLGRPISGVVYLLLCWTLIPVIASLFEVIYLLLMSQEEFDRRFNS